MQCYLDWYYLVISFLTCFSLSSSSKKESGVLGIKSSITLYNCFFCLIDWQTKKKGIYATTSTTTTTYYYLGSLATNYIIFKNVEIFFK
jgi:hypothetical protein